MGDWQEHDDAENDIPEGENGVRNIGMKSHDHQGDDPTEKGDGGHDLKGKGDEEGWASPEWEKLSEGIPQTESLTRCWLRALKMARNN
jgi:hypothetical protein